MKGCTLTGFCCLLLLPCMSVAQDAKNAEDQKLQGTWQVLRQEYDGNDVNTEETRVVISPGKIIIKDKRGERTIPYTLDPSMKPKTIDLTLPSNGTAIPCIGIYQLDGDTLKICFGEKGQARPTEWTSPKGSRLTLFVLRRTNK